MALHGELFASPPTATVKYRDKAVVGTSSHFFSLHERSQWKIRSIRYVVPHAGTPTTAVTQELAPNPFSYPDVSMVTPQDTESLQVESIDNEISYINRLAAEIQECSCAKDLVVGEEVHMHIIECALDSDRYLGNLLVLMYGNCGCIESAEIVFHKIQSPNIFSRNIMINAYVTNDETEEARIFFDDMPEWNLASWNAIISALAKNGRGRDALQYYDRMLAKGFQPDVMTYASTIDACADAAALVAGVRVHSAVIKYGYLDKIMGTALINMYGQCGSLESARYISDKLPEHDILSWSAMIAACAENGFNEEALCMFNEMPGRGLKPTRSTFFSVLTACGSLGSLSQGYAVHAEMLSMDISAYIRIENSLINMYGKCQSLLDSIIIFTRMLRRDVVTWSTMITAQAENDKNKEALELFYLMPAECVNPNNHTISIVLDVCTSMRALEEGQCVYDLSVSLGVELDFIAAIALINMYGAGCRLEDARAVFCAFEEHGVLVWNAMISAYVTNGQVNGAHQLLEEMELRGVKPNKATLKVIEELKSSDEELAPDQDITPGPVLEVI